MSKNINEPGKSWAPLGLPTQLEVAEGIPILRSLYPIAPLQTVCDSKWKPFKLPLHRCLTALPNSQIWKPSSSEVTFSVPFTAFGIKFRPLNMSNKVWDVSFPPAWLIFSQPTQCLLLSRKTELLDFPRTCHFLPIGPAHGACHPACAVPPDRSSFSLQGSAKHCPAPCPPHPRATFPGALYSLSFLALSSLRFALGKPPPAQCLDGTVSLATGVGTWCITKSDKESMCTHYCAVTLKWEIVFLPLSLSYSLKNPVLGSRGDHRNSW